MLEKTPILLPHSPIKIETKLVCKIILKILPRYIVNKCIFLNGNISRYNHVLVNLSTCGVQTKARFRTFNLFYPRAVRTKYYAQFDFLRFQYL